MGNMVLKYRRGGEMHRFCKKEQKLNIVDGFWGTKNSIFKTISLSTMMVFLLLSNPAFAITQQQAQSELSQLNADIASINATINGLKSQKKTLANELAILDAQAQVIQTQINAAQAQIDVLTPQIADTNKQIAQTEADIQKQKDVLKEYIKTIYMDGQTSQLELILNSNSFSDFIDQSQYLSTMTSKIQDTTKKIEAMKAELDAKKHDLDVKMSEAQNLRASQQSQKTALDQQRYQKDSLISQTNGSESAYQSQLTSKVSRKGVLECIASGSCGGDANGQLLVVNSGFYEAQWQGPWGNTIYAPGCSDCTYANYGCLITALAMTHGITPPQEAARHSFTGDGLLIGNTGSLVTGNWGLINSKLANGEKVIFGLNMGGYQHYVLATGITNGQYLINDPYFGAGTTYNTSRVFKAIVPF